MRHFLLKHRVISCLILFVLIFGLTAVIAVSTSKTYSFYIDCPSGLTYEGTEEKDISPVPSPQPIVRLTNLEVSDRYIKGTLAACEAGHINLEYIAAFSDNGQVVQHNAVLLDLTVTRSHMILVDSGIADYAGFHLFYYAVIAFSALMAAYLFWLLRQRLKTDPYCYRVIFYWAAILFCLAICVLYTFVTIISVTKYHHLNAQMLSMLTANVMTAFTVLTTPFVLVFAVSMLISNISLMRHEGVRPANGLGIAAGIVMIFGVLAVIALYIIKSHYPDQPPVLAITYSIVGAFFVIFEVVLAGAMISGLHAAIHRPSFDKDYIIILGCAIRRDGTLYPLLQGRVDKAIAFYRTQCEKTGKKAFLIPSGGQGSDEIMSEGEAMRRYLLSQGIPDEQILPETASTNTMENMQFSKAIIDRIDPHAKAAFATTNYHVFRSGIYAAQAGLQAEGLGSKPKWYFWPNAFLREVAGLFVNQPRLQMLLLILVALLSGISGYVYTLIA